MPQACAKSTQPAVKVPLLGRNASCWASVPTISAREFREKALRPRTRRRSEAVQLGNRTKPRAVKRILHRAHHHAAQRSQLSSGARPGNDDGTGNHASRRRNGAPCAVPIVSGNRRGRDRGAERSLGCVVAGVLHTKVGDVPAVIHKLHKGGAGTWTVGRARNRDTLGMRLRPPTVSSMSREKWGHG